MGFEVNQKGLVRKTVEKHQVSNGVTVTRGEYRDPRLKADVIFGNSVRATGDSFEKAGVALQEYTDRHN